MAGFALPVALTDGDAGIARVRVHSPALVEGLLGRATCLCYTHAGGTGARAEP